MRKLLLVVIALLVAAPLVARADNADDCWANRQTLETALNGGLGTDPLFDALKVAYDNDPTIQIMMSMYNPTINGVKAQRLPTFAEALSAAVQRVCLLNYYPANLENGIPNCISWVPAHFPDREDEVCGANYRASKAGPNQ